MAINSENIKNHINEAVKLGISLSLSPQDMATFLEEKPELFVSALGLSLGSEWPDQKKFQLVGKSLRECAS